MRLPARLLPSPQSERQFITSSRFQHDGNRLSACARPPRPLLIRLAVCLAVWLSGAVVCSAMRALRKATQPVVVWANVPRRGACPACHTATSSVAFATSTPTVIIACSSDRPPVCSSTSDMHQRLLACGPLTTSYAGCARSESRCAPDSLRRADLDGTVLCPGSPVTGLGRPMCGHCTITYHRKESRGNHLNSELCVPRQTTFSPALLR